MKIVSIVGARPQFIKCASVSREIRQCNSEVLIHTGQHYDYEMSQLFFDQIGIPEPDYNLDVGSGPHGEQTGIMLIEIEKVLLAEKPDFVLVYGDTNSTLAGALAAVKMHFPVAHVEAGLRSFNKSMPEEINRVLTDHISDILFAPTETAVKNLSKENIVNGVHLVGDVMYDALQYFIDAADHSKALEKFNLEEANYILATIHRPSNTDNVDNLSSILSALSEISMRVLFPVHPRTVKSIKRYRLEKNIADNVRLVNPIGYFDFLCLEKSAHKIVTDSGGIQKEAYMLNVPCITVRDNTEWVETVRDGWNVLVGQNSKKIVDAINNFNPKGTQSDVFGDGNASGRIKDIIATYDDKNS